MAITHNPLYEEHSRLLAEQAKEQMLKASERARQILSDNAEAAAERIVAYATKSEEIIIDAAVAGVRLNAAKHVLKLVGLEVDRSEHALGGSLTLSITESHAKKVMDAGE